MNDISNENEKINNNNVNSYNYNGAFDDLDLDNLPGIFNENENKSNIDLSQNMNQLLANEEEIPYSPLMSEEPIHSSKTKKIITDNINHKKNEKIHEEIFTFKNNNNNKKRNNFNFDMKDINEKNLYKKLNPFNYYTIDNNKNNENNFGENNENKIKAKILNFEDIIENKNNQILNKSVDIKNDLKIDNPNYRSYDKIDFRKKLNRKEIKGSVKTKKSNKVKELRNKTQKKSNNKINNFENNLNLNSINAVGFESFMKNKSNKNIINHANPNNINNKSSKNLKKNRNLYQNNNNILYKDNNLPKQNTEIISNNNNYNYNKINIEQKKIQIRPDLRLRNINSFKTSKSISENPFIIKKIKKENLNKSKDKNINKKSSDSSFIKNNKNKNTKTGKPNNLRELKKIEDQGVPHIVTEAEINLALKNKNIGNNIQKRYSEINNALINFDNSKFIKYDTEQILYELEKDYTYIHSDKDNSFLQRMQFDALKRKNKEIKLNELVEKNKKKYKINEKERKKTFNRLIDDANRRLIIKQEMIENEKYLLDCKNLFDNNKKYNGEEWSEIYKKRFKDYEEYKNKKIDIQRQNEKIKKMIAEEEEINMCQVKKIPESKIRENTQRLYEDAKKRQILKNKNLKSINSVKNYRVLNKNTNNNLYFNTFIDEEDASKYMKGHRNEAYSFLSDREINNNYKDYPNDNNFKQKNYFFSNNYYYNFNGMNNNFNNKSFDKKIIKKNDKISVTEFNNMRFNTRNNTQKKNKKKKNMNNNNYDFNDNKNQLNNFDRNYKNGFSKYSDFKKNKLQNGLPLIQNNDFSSPNAFGNYNNYNNNSIFNLNNNLNNINNNLDNNTNYRDENDIDNFNLNDITEQLLHNAAINKIKYNNNVDNGIKNNNKENFENEYFDFKKYFSNNSIKNNNKSEKEEYIKNNPNYDSNNAYGINNMVEEFLSRQYVYKK